MRFIAALFFLLSFVSAACAADENLDRLAEALRLNEVVAILREEGLAYGQSLDEEMLGGEGGLPFQQQVNKTYSIDKMANDLKNALGRNMTAEHLVQATVFFDSDLGQKIIALENSARRAYLDPAIEDYARSIYEDLDNNDPRLRLIREYIRVNDLIEQNVRGSFSSDLHFFRGFAEGQDAPVDDGAILSELLEQQDDAIEETTVWLYGFLLMAYQPLTDAQIRENIAFSQTNAGRALNEAFFSGFADMYDRISFDLGMAVARAMMATEL